MKVVHISTNDITGGAAQAAYHLHLAMRKEHVDATMVVGEKRSKDASVIEFGRPPKTIKNWSFHFRRHRIKRDLNRYRSTRPLGYDAFSDDRSAYRESLLDLIPVSDVINLHWIVGLLDYGSVIKNLTDIAPVCWRLSDTNPFTGGCHHNDDCERFKDKCGMCPQLGSNDPNDLSYQIWSRKKAAIHGIEKNKLHIIALNRWMADKVSRSSLFGEYPVSIIPNGVDIDIFAPSDRLCAKEELGIPPFVKVILFLADDISNPRKGYPMLIKALKRIPEKRDTLLVSVGNNDIQADLPLPHKHLGYLNKKELVSKVFNATDIFVLPSIQENQPNTILESLASGTPVVAFKVGGIPEMIQEGITGHLVSPGDVKEMSKVIATLLKDDERREKMRSLCRETAIKEYSRKLQVRRYLKLYESIKEPVF